MTKPKNLTAKGYIRKNNVLEHRRVWEETHAMKVPDGYDVHHINEIKTDNRPENLELIPKDVHTIAHQVGAVRQPDGTWLKPCAQCKALKPVETGYFKRIGWYTPECLECMRKRVGCVTKPSQQTGLSATKTCAAAIATNAATVDAQLNSPDIESGQARSHKSERPSTTPTRRSTGPPSDSPTSETSLDGSNENGDMRRTTQIEQGNGLSTDSPDFAEPREVSPPQILSECDGDSGTSATGAEIRPSMDTKLTT